MTQSATSMKYLKDPPFNWFMIDCCLFQTLAVFQLYPWDQQIL